MIINIPPYYCDSADCVPSYSVVWEVYGKFRPQPKGKELKKIIAAQKLIWERAYKSKEGGVVQAGGRGGTGGYVRIDYQDGSYCKIPTN